MAENTFSLIDLKALAKNQTQVQDIENRTAERKKNRDLRRQKNIESIAAKALEALPGPEAVSQNPVDGDWVAMFFEQCQDVSNEQMQSLWAKLLAGEVTAPGSYSLRTLALVKVLSQQDAELFTRFCSFLWSEPGTGALVPFVNRGWDDHLQQKGLSFPYLLHLQSLGLIELLPGFGFTKAGTSGTMEFSYYGKKHSITLPSGHNQFSLGIALLTEIGHQLAPIAGAEPDEDYRQCVVKWWRASNYQVVEHDRGEGNGSGKASHVAPPAPAHQAQEAEIVVGTPEWDNLTERRAALIDKMYSPGQGLTEEEQAEYEQLQQRSRAAIERAYPRPKLAPDELAAVKQALSIKDDADGQ